MFMSLSPERVSLSSHARVSGKKKGSFSAISLLLELAEAHQKVAMERMG